MSFVDDAALVVNAEGKVNKLSSELRKDWERWKLKDLSVRAGDEV